MGNSRSDHTKGKDQPKRITPLSHPLGDLGSMQEIIRKIDKAQDEPQPKQPDKSHLLLEQRPFVDREERDDPLRMADEIIGDARQASGTRRVELAEKALEVSQDCADAYVILAEETARSLEAAKQLYEKGVKAGERVLGTDALTKESDRFWLEPQAQPYMRARAGLARCLWSLGQKQEAIGHCADMLRLNPSDDQGIRYLLANWLLHEGLDEDLENLLQAFEGDSTSTWLYTRALWAFGREGATPKANGYLQEAFKQNPFVPSYLLGLKKMPGILPEHVEAGDEREAISYIAEALNTWLKTEGALEWLIITLPRVLQRPRVNHT